MLQERRKHRILPSGTVMMKHDYYPLADKIRDDLINQGVDRYDIHTSEFIGIHSSIRQPGSFTLSSPMYLVDDQGTRPSFENEIFLTFAECLKQAIDISLKHDTFVVIVDDPVTGQTLDTGR